MQHAFEDYHSKWFVPARHDQNICTSIPLGHLVRSEPPGEMNLMAIRCQRFVQPRTFNLIRGAITPSQHKLHVRFILQYTRDRLKEFANAFPIDEPTRVKHNGRRASPLALHNRTRGSGIVNPIPDYSDSLTGFRTVLRDQSSFVT